MAECLVGTRLVVLEGITSSGKTTLTKNPFALGSTYSANIEFDNFLKRPVPEITPYVEAIDRYALDADIEAALEKFPLVIAQGAIAWPLMLSHAVRLGKDRTRRVYLKRMRYLDPNFWADEDFILDREYWPPTIFHRSIYRYHAAEQPWLAADLVVERVEERPMPDGHD